MDELIKKLQEWCTTEHENVILSRNDVCVLLDGIRAKELEYDGLWDQYIYADEGRTGD